MFEFDALFLGRMENTFKDKETKEQVAYYNLSFLPLSKVGMPLLVKANKDGFDAYAGVDPLEQVRVKFVLSKDGVLKVVG